jgi:surface antigen
MAGMKTATMLMGLALAALPLAVSGAQATSSFDTGGPGGGSGGVVSGVLQCVPYARDVSGIRIYGDAHTWWEQAQGRYARGSQPRVGAVMAIRPAGNSRLGHVAAVSGVIDSRTVLLRHANWSSPGQIEDNVRAIDVSPDNDWSEVRIWHGPSGQLGVRHWPLYGFIYRKDAPLRGFGAPRAAAKTSKRRPNDLIGDIIAGRLR